MARDIQLINCSGTIVHGDVERFIALGVDGLTVDNTYSNMMLIGHTLAAIKPSVKAVTADFTIDGQYQIYEIDLDTAAADISCTWVASTYPIEVTFKIVSNSGGYDFIITTDPLPSGMLVELNAVPYITPSISRNSYTFYSNGTDINLK